MNVLSSKILLPAIKILLANKIQKIASEVGTTAQNLPSYPDTDRSNPSNLTNCPGATIPLKRVKNVTRVWYVSAIAFHDASAEQHTPLYRAQAIASSLYKALQEGTDQVIQPDQHNSTTNTSRSLTTSQFLCKIWKNSTTWVTFPGWIHWQLSPTGVTEWLNLLQAEELTLLSAPSNLPTLNAADLPFHVFHTHARCCSLLRAAQRSHWLSPSTTPSLSVQPAGDRPFHSAEWQLILSLIDAIDEIGLHASNQPLMQRQAQHLSTSFQQFHAQCRLDNLSETGELRWGLVTATQRVLRLLLEERLGLEAPTSL